MTIERVAVVGRFRNSKVNVNVLIQYKNIKKMHTRRKSKKGSRGIFFIKFVLKGRKKI